MTTPSGLPLAALQFWGAARGAVAQRVSTAEFYATLQTAAEGFGLTSHGLTFQNVNQLRSAAASVRNSAEAFERLPEQNAISAREIGVTPYARSLAEQAALPMYHVGITLHTADDDGNLTSEYKAVRFTGQLPATKRDLLQLVQQDAEALADTYNQQYVGHDVLEVLGV